MEQYREGLNYLPFLTQQHQATPPSSVRSRISLNTKLSRCSTMHYNGNYEGDNSMFQGNGFELERFSLVDSESDTELNDTLSCASMEKTSVPVRVCQFFMQKCLQPEIKEHISKRIDHFTESSFFKSSSKWSRNIIILFTFIFYFITILYTHLTTLCRFLWRRRLIFHNLTRRLLWRLTVAKCSDLSLFLYILMSIPALFVLCLMGSIITIGGYLKDILDHCRHIVNKIQLL